MITRSTRGRRAAVIGVSLGVLTTALLSGCSGAGNGSGGADGVVLEFPNFQASEAPFSTWWEEFVAAFEEKYPDVTVDMTDSQNSDRYQETLLTRFAAGDPPEIVQQTTTNFFQLAGADYLADVGDLVPSSWGPLQDTYEWNGETVGVMTLASGLVLYYNEKLLQDAGVDVPTTPEELVKAAEAVYDPANGIYGFAGVSAPQDPKLYNESAMFVVGSGGEWFDGDTPDFTSPEVIKGLGYYKQALATAPPGLQFTQRNELFQSGKAGFMVENANFLGAIQQQAPADVKPFLKPAAVPFPNEPGLASVELSIPKSLDGPTLEAARNFVALAVSPEWQKRYAEVIGAPAPDPDSTADLIAQNPYMELFVQLQDEAVSILPTGPEVRKDFPIYRKEIFDSLVSITSGAVSIEDAMKQLQSSTESQLGS